MPISSALNPVLFVIRVLSRNMLQHDQPAQKMHRLSKTVLCRRAQVPLQALQYSLPTPFHSPPWSLLHRLLLHLSGALFTRRYRSLCSCQSSPHDVVVGKFERNLVKKVQTQVTQSRDCQEISTARCWHCIRLLLQHNMQNYSKLSDAEPCHLAIDCGRS